MYKAVIDQINSLSPLTPEAEVDLVSKFKTQSFDKNEFILNEGQKCSNLYFILDGTIRLFTNYDGTEVTYWIYPEDMFFTSWHSFINKNLSKEAIQSIAKTEVCYITQDDLYELYDKHHCIERFGRRLLEHNLSTWDDFYKGFTLLTAKQKYEHLLEVYPSVIQRANLGYIASMLGITSETLSRIRRS